MHFEFLRDGTIIEFTFFLKIGQQERDCGKGRSKGQLQGSEKKGSEKKGEEGRRVNELSCRQMMMSRTPTMQKEV